MKFIAPLILGCALLTACGTTNNVLATKTKTIEYYRIFDIKTTAQLADVITAASNGLGRNVNNADEATPIPDSSELPDKPGRFKLVNPLAGSNLAAFAGGAGSIGIKVATCDGARWTAKAQRDTGGNGDLQLSACLYPYKGGYHLDLYAVFSKQEGGISQLARSTTYSLVGTPEQWTEKTFNDIVRMIKAKTKSDISLVEALPAVSGTPWLDALDAPKN
ncbi:MAG TPA: hypothetical protein PK129_05815 [Cellvibrionaceae bacterium]|nr:hypothetical protein [Cellvibrionaceae bacterium]